MTDERSLERAARSFIEPGPTRAPEAAVEAALGRIQTTPQERDWHVLRRDRPMTMPARLLVAAIAIAVVGAGALILRPSGPGVGSSGPVPTPGPSASPSAASSSGASSSRGPVDYSDLPGRILAEHFGNALDLSESSETDYNPDKRRFYFLDPADMTNATAEEFLRGTPTTGKTAADVSADGSRVVFQDWAEEPRLYEANLDGTGFHEIEIGCDCQLLYPDYDPAAERIVYVRIEGAESWLEIRDLSSGKTTPLVQTRGPAADDVPEQPAWSPDGASIAFSRLHWGDGRNEPVVGTVRYGDKPPLSGVLSILTLSTGAVRDVPLPDETLPGDVNWSPDSTALVFTHGPGSTMGSVANMPGSGARSVRVDGTGFRSLPGWSGPAYLPDGSKILTQNNWFYLMEPDGTGLRAVNHTASDLSDLAQGFVYIGHWVE